MLDEMLELFSYNRWAHDRTLTATEQLDSEQFTRTLGGDFPSVQATLEHLLQVEWVWLGRWQGNETEQRLGATMRHVVNHATYHRGQVATMLRQLGAVPTGTDLFTYLYESSRTVASSSAATR